MPRLACISAAVVALTLVLAGAARADADPASDVLYARNVFLPLSERVSPQLASKLYELTQAARAAGKPIRVAVIASPTDLGGVPSLFGDPKYYARFLGAELQFLYTGKLLVVMPQGAGLSKAGRLLADPAVVHAKIEPRADGLVRTAIKLVIELTGVEQGGEQTVLPASSSESGGWLVWLWVVIAAGATGALTAVGLVVVRRRLRT